MKLLLGPLSGSTYARLLGWAFVAFIAIIFGWPYFAFATASHPMVAFIAILVIKPWLYPALIVLVTWATARRLRDAGHPIAFAVAAAVALLPTYSFWITTGLVWSPGSMLEPINRLPSAQIAALACLLGLALIPTAATSDGTAMKPRRLSPFLYCLLLTAGIAMLDYAALQYMKSGLRTLQGPARDAAGKLLTKSFYAFEYARLALPIVVAWVALRYSTKTTDEQLLTHDRLTRLVTLVALAASIYLIIHAIVLVAAAAISGPLYFRLPLIKTLATVAVAARLLQFAALIALFFLLERTLRSQWSDPIPLSNSAQADRAAVSALTA